MAACCGSVGANCTRIVGAIEALHRDRLGEQIERLAHHAVRGERREKAVEFAPGQAGSTAYALHLLGDIAAHPERFDAQSGEAHYRRALALAEPRGMRPLVAHCRLGLGTLHQRVGQEAQARAELASAAELYRAMAMPFWLEQAGAGIPSSRD